MLRVIRSTVQGLDIDAELEDGFADAAQAGKLLRETYSTNEHGQKDFSIAVRAYTDPEGQNRFAVLYSTPSAVDWQDTDDYVEARNLYEGMVRESENGAAGEIDEHGNEKPVFTATDVPGVDGYEDGAEGEGDAEAYMLLAEWATAEAEEAQRIAAEKAQARQIAYALAVDTFGRGGNAVLARRAGKKEPTVKDIADRGRVILEAQHKAQFSVDLYEDNAGGLYLLRAGDTTGWSLGFSAEQTCGPFAEDAAAWREGDWQPNEHDGQTPEYGMGTESLTHIATWSAKDGLEVIKGATSEPAAGAAGRIYLGLGNSATWSVVRGESPDSRAVEPGPAGIDVPNAILAWAEAHGHGPDDVSVYLLVTPTDEAGEVMGELACTEHPMTDEEMTVLRDALSEQDD
ncbi:hypothetical protein [Streptomyces sp. NPDC047985]|uniref:hypothetical protein n=1 Tax=Streptomyces sp. NPDC047985 TaxID=3155384 RepID=UPI00342A8A28